MGFIANLAVSFRKLAREGVSATARERMRHPVASDLIPRQGVMANIPLVSEQETGRRAWHTRRTGRMATMVVPPLYKNDSARRIDRVIDYFGGTGCVQLLRQRAPVPEFDAAPAR